MAKLSFKEVEDIFGLKTASLPDEQKQFVTALIGAFVETVNKSMEGVLDTETLKEALKPYQCEDGVTLKSLSEENAELVTQVKNLSDTLDKLKKKGIGLDYVSKFNERFDEMYDSPQFQDFLNGKEKGTSGFAFKDISVTNNIAPGGTVTMTQQSGRVVSQATNKKKHVRDFATVLPGDPEYPIFSFQQIYEVDRNARYVPENGMLPESSLKIKEESAEVKRVGHHFKLSKRALKCKAYLRGYVMTCLLAGVRDAEDFAILYGDGSGDAVKGITRYEGVQPVESIIADTIVSGDAGSVLAITKAGNGVIVELTNAHDLLIEGLRITFAGATKNTALNSTFDVIKLNDRQIFLEGATLTSDAAADLTADAAAMTFKVNNSAFKSVESPNSVDALETAITVMTYGQFAPTLLVLNPITINSIRTEKATDGNRLKVVEDIDGNLIVGGLRAVPYTGIPAGKYFLGDMQNGAQIIDYTPLTVEWADDVNTKLKNQVVLMAHSEEIVPVFCPWAFAYGNINALKIAIAKD